MYSAGAFSAATVVEATVRPPRGRGARDCGQRFGSGLAARVYLSCFLLIARAALAQSMPCLCHRMPRPRYGESSRIRGRAPADAASGRRADPLSPEETRASAGQKGLNR